MFSACKALLLGALVGAAPAEPLQIPAGAGQATLVAHWYPLPGAAPKPAVLALHGCGGLYQRDGTTLDARYPAYRQLLAELGVPTQPTTMTFALRNERSGLEYNAGTNGGLFLLQIYDSIMLMVRDEDVEKTLEFLIALMKDELPERQGYMDGVPLSVDVKKGKSWGSLEKVKQAKKP